MTNYRVFVPEIKYYMITVEATDEDSAQAAAENILCDPHETDWSEKVEQTDGEIVDTSHHWDVEELNENGDEI